MIADLAGVDAVAIWEWGFPERVTSGLYVRAVGMVHKGDAFLETAERLASDRAGSTNSAC